MDYISQLLIDLKILRYKGTSIISIVSTTTICIYTINDTTHQYTRNIDVSKTRPIGGRQYADIVRPRKTMDYAKNNPPIRPKLGQSSVV